MTHHGCRVQTSMMRTIADFSMELDCRLPPQPIGSHRVYGQAAAILPDLQSGRAIKADHATFGLVRIAWPAKVFPSDQMAPGTRWLLAITESNALKIQLQSALEMVRAGRSLIVWLTWPATWLRILWSLKSGIVM